MKKRETCFHLISGDRTDSLPLLPQGHYYIRDSYRTESVFTEPIFDVGAFKHSDSHISWELEKTYDYTSPYTLLKKFRQEWRWFTKPVAWARNPEKDGQPIFGPQDVIVAVYPCNFYIQVERGDMFGPHAARLYYRSYQKKNEVAWVAICQIEGLWHSDEKLLKSLNHEIRNKHLWHSTETANLVLIE